MSGRLSRIYALMLQELYVTRHAFEVFVDLFFLPLMNVILFGLITRLFKSVGQSTTSDYLLLGILLWQFVSVSQNSVTYSALWNVWSHNLSNMFIAPISVTEYLLGNIFAAILKAFLTFSLLSLGVYFAFHFDILRIGVINVGLDYINLSIFGWSLGVLLLGLIFRYGTRVQAVAWGAIYLFQPLTASFYPVTILPRLVQYISICLPPTHVFQAARQSLSTSGISWHAALVAFSLNIFYAVLSIVVFNRLFLKSKETGQFARNDL